MIAIILAAGLSSRLGAAFGFRPKILLTVNGETLLDRHLRILNDHGFEEIILVTGFNHEYIENHLKKINSKNIELVFNPFFRDFGSLYSLSQSANFWQEDNLVIDGDLCYDPMAIKILSESSQNAIIVTPHSGSGDESMPIFKNGVLSNFQKDSRLSLPEYIGISKFSGFLLKDMIKIRPNSKVPYEEALAEAVRDKGHHLSFVYVPGLKWKDVDTESDLKIMKKIFEY